jgi:lysophospholipase L1-like esterase
VNPSFDALSEPSTIRFFARLPYVNLVRAEAFQPLESPEWFWDGLHMNASGRQRFSCMMVHELEPLLGKEDR